MLVHLFFKDRQNLLRRLQFWEGGAISRVFERRVWQEDARMSRVLGDWEEGHLVLPPKGILLGKNSILKDRQELYM